MTLTARELRPILVLGGCAGLFLALLAAGLSYVLYWEETRVSRLPLDLSLLVSSLMLIGTGYLAFVLRYDSLPRLTHLGLGMLIAFMSWYYFFGVFGFFFYVIFAPLPDGVKAVGYIIGIGVHVWWIGLAYVDLRKALKSTAFVENAYESDPQGQHLYYDRQKWLHKISNIMNRRSLPHQGQLWAALAIAPIAPFLGRFFAPGYEGLGVSTIVAYLSLPLGLWILRASFFPFISLVWYPLKLKRLTGKTVVLTS